jgi:cardiolipin synthase A/B
MVSPDDAARAARVAAGAAAETPTLAPEGRRIDRALARASGATLRRGNRLTLLRDGPATYDDWLGAIGRAERWVHLENYIFKADEIGRRFAGALAERAAAGVPVRVLYDWYGSLDVAPRFWRRLRAAGVDVRAVNPPVVGAPLGAVRRDHRKLLAVDGAYASVGGVGIADAWLEPSPRTGLPYRDTAVRVIGPAVADVERAFAGVWDRSGAPLPLGERPRADRIAPAGDDPARVIIQEPGRLRILRALQIVTAAVERRLWIADAYFLAVPIMRESLMASARDGVDVRILLPSTNDLPVVGALSRYGYRPLLEAGVRIWEYGGPMMHAKTTVADGWWSRVGSTNLNVTGLLTNWEIDLVAEERGFGAEMEAMFEDDLAQAREVRVGAPAGRRRQPAGRRARDLSRGSGPQAATTVASVGGAALQAAAAGNLLGRHERKVGAAIGGVALGASLLGARFPRLIAWPLAAIAGSFGATTLLRAARSSESAEAPPADEDALDPTGGL